MGMKPLCVLMLLSLDLSAAEDPGVLHLKFVAYDEPGKKGKASFQMNRPGAPSAFLEIGDVIPGTDFKLSRFTKKEPKGAITGVFADVSELEIVHRKIGVTATLVHEKVAAIPIGSKRKSASR